MVHDVTAQRLQEAVGLSPDVVYSLGAPENAPSSTARDNSRRDGMDRPYVALLWSPMWLPESS